MYPIFTLGQIYFEGARLILYVIAQRAEATNKRMVGSDLGLALFFSLIGRHFHNACFTGQLRFLVVPWFMFKGKVCSSLHSMANAVNIFLD